MPYGQPHTAPSPGVSVTLGPAYATLVNAVLAEFRTTLNAKVTPSGMDINADLSMLSGITYSGITNAHRLSMYVQPSLLSATTYPASLYVNSAGELYFNDNSSNQVVLTASGSVAGTAGSITSLAPPATVTWDLANTRYLFKTDVGANDFAHIAIDSLLLQDGSANQLTIASPALASDYTITLPNAVPAANGTLMQFATTGTATFANTSLAAVSLAANSSFTVSGTGRYKHGAFSYVIPGAAFVCQNPAGSYIYDTNSGRIANNSATDIVVMAPVMLPAGKRITNIQWSLNHGAGATTRTYDLVERNLGAGTNAVLNSLTDATNGGGAFQISAGAVSLDIMADRMYWVTAAITESSDRVYGVELFFTDP